MSYSARQNTKTTPAVRQKPQPIAVSSASAATLTRMQQQANALSLQHPVAALQRMAQGYRPALQRQQNNPNGLPDKLRSGIENLSGVAMDDVKVHRNSAAPQKVGALAYAQGRDIHLGPGQEKHLPHEAWHVVQQAQGRVKPTVQAKGVAINDDPGLEKEADVMSSKAVGMGQSSGMLQAKAATPTILQRVASPGIIQRVILATTARENFRDGRHFTHFSNRFINKHLPLGGHDNVAAARTHGTRQNQPATNTVVMDGSTLKDELANQATWTSSGNHWVVRTASPVAVLNTTRHIVLNRPDGPPAMIPDTANFTIASGQVTDLDGATPLEIQAANIARGTYPTNRRRRGQYKTGYIRYINEQRTANANATILAWIRNGIASINGTAVHGNAAITSLADINAIAAQSLNVTVWVSQDTGDIYHLAGTP